jgi:hypothetical protein
MFLPYERSLQPGLVGAGVIVPVAGLIEAEILILRHQLNIQRRHLPKRLAFSAMDRLVFGPEAVIQRYQKLHGNRRVERYRRKIVKECRLSYNFPRFGAGMSEELTMAKSILVIAILALSTSSTLAAHRTHHPRHAMNALARVGASPVVSTGGVSSSDRAMYIRNLRDAGYNPKSDFNASGTLKTQ